MGLYSVLWGKHKENLEPVKAIQANGNTILVIGDTEANEVELQNAEANNKLSTVSITMPKPESPIKANQDQK